jgi:hypothetical protein
MILQESSSKRKKRGEIKTHVALDLSKESE